MNELPIGGFYLWRPTGDALDPKPKAFGERKIITQAFNGYLIDGQQRLTSLEAAFGLFSGQDKLGDPLRCYLDLGATDLTPKRTTRLFVTYGGNKTVARRVNQTDPSLVPLSELFSGQNQDLRRVTGDSLKEVGWSNKRIDNAIQVFDRACRMLDQLVPCTTVADISDKDAVLVFDRLNKGGTALRQGDVRAAELARGTTVAVLRHMREFVSKPLPQRLGFGFSFAFRALVVFHSQSAQFARLKDDWMEAPGPHGRQLKDSWEATERAVNEALQFADEKMGWSRRILIPSANALIVLAAVLDRAKHKITSTDEQELRRWLCLTAMRQVFQGSVETTINRFLRRLKDATGSPVRAVVDALHSNEGRKFHADEFLQPAQLWGPATQVMHTWLVSENASDWLETERTIDVLARGGSPTPGGDLTVHHIFARQALFRAGEYPETVNRPANFALLSRSTNAVFGDQHPDEVLNTLNPSQRQAASAQFFGEAAGDLLKLEKYQDFCEWRAKRLAEVLNRFVGFHT